jgi:hypothetical protein
MNGQGSEREVSLLWDAFGLAWHVHGLTQASPSF